MIKKICIFILLGVSMLKAQQLELSATIISDNEKLLTSRYMGFVKDVYVNEGDRVKKGKLLYEIDSIDIDSKKEQAVLNVQILNNQYQNSKLNYERYQRLYKKDLVSKFDLEQITLTFKNTKDNLAISKARLKEIKNQYRYLKVKAPNDGIILRKSLKTGEMAIPGTPAIVLSDLNSLKVKTEVTQSDLKFLNIGDKVQISIESMDYLEKGRIASIVPSSNAMTHTFVLKIDFENSSKLYPGMYAKVIIDTKKP